MTEMTWDGFRPISNTSDISFAMGMFFYKKINKKKSHRTVGTLISVDLNDFRSFLLCFSLKGPYTCDYF